jgi:hypothetical protein
MVKNIAEHENNNFSLYQFNPTVSVGPFIFGTDIENYFEYHHTYFPAGKYDSFDSYYFLDPPITIFPKGGKIESITCDEYLFFKGRNIIGMLVHNFMEVYQIAYDVKERLYVMRDDNIKSMIVYDFDILGLQIWTYRRKIISVSCTKYEDG